MLARPDSVVEFAEVAVDPPLGVGRQFRPRRSTTIPFPPGALLFFYTDGLVERRDEVIDTGLRRLADMVRAENAEEVCVAVMADSGMEQPGDDVAVLAVRRHA